MLGWLECTSTLVELSVVAMLANIYTHRWDTHSSIWQSASLRFESSKMGTGSSKSATKKYEVAVEQTWDAVMKKFGPVQNSEEPEGVVIRRSGWKTIRVFVSSTFKDFHAEREVLVKEVFPDLRAWCEKRRLHLVDCDLRWVR